MPVKQVITVLLVIHEQFNVLENFLFHRDSVMVSDGIFTKEVKFHHEFLAIQFFMQRHVLNSEGTATNRISLIFVLLITSPECKLVNEVESDRPLPHTHLLVLHVLHVAISNFMNAVLQLSGLLILLPILLPLQPGARVEHDVLDLPLDVFCPAGQPGNCVVVLHFLPLVTSWRLRNIRVLTAVNDDILGHDSPLDHSLLRVLASTSEQGGRLSSEISDPFFVSVHCAESILLNNGLVLLFLCLFLLFGPVLPLLGHFLEMLVNFREVTLAKVPDDVFLLLCHRLSPVLEEVLVEDFLGGIGMVQHPAIESCTLLGVFR